MISSISSYNPGRVNFKANQQKVAKSVVNTAENLGAKVVNKAPKGLTSNSPLRFDPCYNNKNPQVEDPCELITSAYGSVTSAMVFL